MYTSAEAHPPARSALSLCARGSRGGDDTMRIQLTLPHLPDEDAA